MVKDRIQERSIKIGDHDIYLAQESELPEKSAFVGRENELMMCRIAWGLDENYRFRNKKDLNNLSFRLYGEPGMGKNELVYELVRQIRKNNGELKELPFYSMVGHDEMAPEDMVLAVVPTESSGHSQVRMVLRASPLATAILNGGIFFFDELNRLPERALAPLAPALDGRGMLFSASSGIWLEPAGNALPFRFCCALNPSVGSDLPGYIDQRTLPKIEVKYPGHIGLLELLRSQLTADLSAENEYENSCEEVKKQRIAELSQHLEIMLEMLKNRGDTPSVRQGLIIIRLARALFREKKGGLDFSNCLKKAFGACVF